MKSYFSRWPLLPVPNRGIRGSIRTGSPALTSWLIDCVGFCKLETDFCKPGCGSDSSSWEAVTLELDKGRTQGTGQAVRSLCISKCHRNSAAHWEQDLPLVNKQPSPTGANADEKLTSTHWLHLGQECPLPSHTDHLQKLRTHCKQSDGRTCQRGNWVSAEKEHWAPYSWPGGSQQADCFETYISRFCFNLLLLVKEIHAHSKNNSVNIHNTELSQSHPQRNSKQIFLYLLIQYFFNTSMMTPYM